MLTAVGSGVGVPFVVGGGEITGPSVDASPTTSINYAEVGVPVTLTAGTFSALGGGAVNVVQELRLDSPTGPVQPFSSPYTPLVTDKPRRLYYVVTATETGGTAPGTQTRTIDLGVVFDRDFVNDDMVFEADTPIDTFINHNMIFLVDPDPDGDFNNDFNDDFA